MPPAEKVAVVLALLIKSDYPEVWADAFEQLEGLLRGAGGRVGYVDLYFRVLGALDEEVVSFHVDRTREEVEHNSRIKVRAGGGGVNGQVRQTRRCA